DCTRRQELKREASETRCAQTADASLSVSVPGDASPSNGDSLQKPLHKQLQLQLQLSLRGQLQLSLRGQGPSSAGLKRPGVSVPHCLPRLVLAWPQAIPGNAAFMQAEQLCLDHLDQPGAVLLRDLLYCIALN
ncbi:MAG: hypothetical protein JWM30_2551, partial [Burkholderia sp.]|nr:hypothetical protein [Burkholderia sp.]